MDISGTLVQFRLSPEGERALQEYVPGSRFSAYVLDSDFIGLWILTGAAMNAEAEGAWPSLFVKWELVEGLSAIYAQPEAPKRSPVGFRPQR